MPEENKGPAPEVLSGKGDKPTDAAAPGTPGASPAGSPTAGGKRPKWMKRGGYQPSHKATFIAVGVVAGILLINGGIIGFVVTRQKAQEKSTAAATLELSQDALDKVGINRSAVGSSGVELVVNPDAKFNNKVAVGGDVTVSGQLKMNNKATISEANIAKLEASDVALAQLNVNGAGTFTELNLRNNLNVNGVTRLNSEVIVNKLMTVNSNVTVAGSFSVGGTLTVQNFQTSRLTIDSTLTIGGHIITRGNAPTISQVGSLGSSGTLSISGNDASGTIAINVGAGGSPGGTLVNVTFKSPYSTTPHVVVTAVGGGLGSVFVTRSTSGFTVGVNGAIATGGYAFDYIVMQ